MVWFASWPARRKSGWVCRCAGMPRPSRPDRSWQGRPETGNRSLLDGETGEGKPMTTASVVMLKPVVRFREFPFGTAADPSMRESMSDRPWEYQARVLEYLRSGLVLGVTMGADLTDWFDPPARANPLIDGERRGGVTEMTDGVWFWYAGLIHFVEKYNVRVPAAFVEHAARHGWRVDREAIPVARYEFSYFEPGGGAPEPPVRTG